MLTILRKENIVQKHKWYNEIVAWASGAEIEQYHSILGWIAFDGHRDHFFEANDYRIKPQPVEVVATGQPFRFKEKKYLYAYQLGFEYKFSPLKKELMQFSAGDRAGDFKYIGKIEVEND